MPIESPVEHISGELSGDYGSVQRDDVALLAMWFDCVPEARSSAFGEAIGKQRVLPT
jgi:hypothetical protein